MYFAREKVTMTFGRNCPFRSPSSGLWDRERAIDSRVQSKTRATEDKGGSEQP